MTKNSIPDKKLRPNKSYVKRKVLILLIFLFMLACFQFFYQKQQKNAAPVLPRTLPQKQRVEHWSQSERINTTDEKIDEFIKTIFESEVGAPPAGGTKVNWKDLTSTEQDDLFRAASGFFKAYRTDDPEIVFEYLTKDRGETAYISEIKKNLQEYIRNIDKKDPPESDKDLFKYFWKLQLSGTKNAVPLKTDGSFSLWKSNAITASEQMLQKNVKDAELFQSITAFPHLFETTHQLIELQKAGKEIMYCDLFFVWSYGPSKENKFSPAGIRFWYSSERSKWIPLNLVLVSINPDKKNDIHLLF